MKQDNFMGGDVYGVYDTDSQDYRLNRLPELGARVRFSDGREYVFVKTAVDLVAGQLVGAPNAIAELVGKFTAATAGSEEVEIEKTGVTANLYANGMLVITNSAGQETCYGIKSNTASSASDKVTLKLTSPLIAAVATADDCIIVPSRYSNVIVNIATTDPVGVAVRASTAATDSKTNYLWVQTKGIGGVVVTTAAGLTKGVAAMPTAAGSVVVANGTLRPVGVMLPASAVSNGDVAPINLDLP